MIRVPDGYSVRPARFEDAAALLVPNHLREIHFMGESEYTLELLHKDLALPGTNIATDSLVVWAPDGKTCAGYVMVNTSPPHLRMMVAGLTHPEHEHLGIGTALFSWGLARTGGRCTGGSRKAGGGAW